MLIDSGCLPATRPDNLRVMRQDHPLRRFTRSDPCPICGGYDALGRGRGVRCYGYYDPGGHARCTREDHAGSLPQNRDGTFSHRLDGACRCGREHGAPIAAATARRTTAAPGCRRGPGPGFRSFFTLVAGLRRRYGAGTTVRHWTYRDADGAEVFRVVRVDYRAPDGSRAKSYRPCHKGADGRWRLEQPDRALPLYRLPELRDADPDATVVVVEGEKCAVLAAAAGLLPVTTSAHGAKAPQLTDWTPLAGRDVAILGDADSAGASYATQVAAILESLDPPARVRIVALPGLAEGEDIEQFLTGRRAEGRSDVAILAELQALIAG